MFVKGIISSFSSTKQQAYKDGYLLPVMDVETLLAAGRHQVILGQLKERCGVTEEYYEAFYRETVHRFVEFVQVLPTEANGALCGLMNEGIARAMVALQTYQTEHSKHTDPLRSFAVFTAALFQNVSHVLINQRIVLTTEDGHFIDNWNPFSGSMVGKSNLYRIINFASPFQRLDFTLRHLFARQIMPKTAYQWLSSDLTLLADWFDAIDGNETQGGMLVHILAYSKPEDVMALQNSLVQVPVKQKESTATEHGNEFYRWLKNRLQEGLITLNTVESGIHIVNEGLFIEKGKLFKDFLETYNQPVTLAVVYAQFGNLMGIAKKGGYDFMNAQYFSDYAGTQEAGARAFASPLEGKQHSLRDGMVLADPNMILSNSQTPSVSPLLRSMQSKGLAHYDLPSLENPEPDPGPSNSPSPTPKPDSRKY